jgi:hypothetical protein
MDLVTALFLDVRRRWIELVVKALSASSGSSFRATAYWHLERRREPSQRLVKPMDFSRTHVTRRVQKKCARIKENAL